MKTWSVLCLALVLGCGPQMMWTKPGFNQVDWQRDAYQCESDMRNARLSFGEDYLGIQQSQFAGRCLQSKGYYLAPTTAQPSASTLPGANPAQQALAESFARGEMTSTEYIRRFDELGEPGSSASAPITAADRDLDAELRQRKPPPEAKQSDCTPIEIGYKDPDLQGLNAQCRYGTVGQDEYYRRRAEIMNRR